jgi:internalin A
MPTQYLLQEADRRIARTAESEALSLNLSGLDLTMIPKPVFQLANLEVLELVSNQLTAIPEALSRLTKLQKLYLGNNQISVIPRWVGQLANLREFHLSNNQIAAIPEALGQLASLRKLHLSDNQIAAIPEALGQLAGLRELRLNNNRIAAIPEALGQLASLQELHLSSNQITAIPAALGRLTYLYLLYVGHNQIAAIPEALCQIANLQLLDFDDNQITVIPEALGQLTNLRELNLSHNQITAIPEIFGEMPKLTGLYLHGNPGLGIPREILGPSRDDVKSGNKQPKPPREIVDYFKSLTDAKPLNEAKLIMVGQGAVGKTSLVKTLTTGKFKGGEMSTEGIKISDWSCSIAGNNRVKVHIWDFGGQEMMHATHQFFLTARSLYLLVLNRRTGGCDREGDYWLRLIRAFGGKDAPVIVVLNKHKSEPFDVNRGGLAGEVRGQHQGLCGDRLRRREIHHRAKAENPGAAPGDDEP